jgi:surface antigen
MHKGECMQNSSRLLRMTAVAAAAAGALAVAAPVSTYGDPPQWAPAHGKRKRSDEYNGYTGKRWRKDYGVLEGRCNREAVGAVVGAAAGGAIGSRVAKNGDRPVAILVGTVAGAIIGAQIGRDIDETDRACIGHALELAGDKKRVTWTGADNRTTYLLTPLRGVDHAGANCREFDLVVSAGGKRDTSRARACPGGDGTWRIIS